MSPAVVVLIGVACAAVLGLLCKLYLTRKRRAVARHAWEAGPSSAERNAARTRIIEEVKRLDALEAETPHLCEGSGPGFLPDGAEERRREAAKLHAKLEAECRRYRLPLGLVRRRRSSLVPTVGLLQ